MMEHSLSDEQKDKALKWLEEKWPEKNHPCEVCSNKKWQILKVIIASRPYLPNGRTTAEEIIPHFVIMCKNCGNTKYFNAILSGLVEEQGEGKSDD
jgi:hypothetical protein